MRILPKLIPGIFICSSSERLASVPERAEAAPALPRNYISAAGLPHPYVFAKPGEYRALLTRHTQITEKALARLQDLVADELRQGSEYTRPIVGAS